MTRSLSSLAVFNLHRRSLIRGNLLVLGSFAAAFPLSGFPHNRPTLVLLIPAFLALCGTVDTLRCIQRHRSLYYAGIVLCLFMDMMVVCLILLFLLFPYLF